MPTNLDNNEVQAPSAHQQIMAASNRHAYVVERAWQAYEDARSINHKQLEEALIPARQARAKAKRAIEERYKAAYAEHFRTYHAANERAFAKYDAARVAAKELHRQAMAAIPTREERA